MVLSPAKDRGIREHNCAGGWVWEYQEDHKMQDPTRCKVENDLMALEEDVLQLRDILL